MLMMMQLSLSEENKLVISRINLCISVKYYRTAFNIASIIIKIRLFPPHLLLKRGQRISRGSRTFAHFNWLMLLSIHSNLKYIELWNLNVYVSPEIREPFMILSGGLSYDTVGRRACLTVMHGKSTTVLEMDYPIVDFLTLCETPYPNGEL